MVEGNSPAEKIISGFLATLTKVAVCLTLFGAGPARAACAGGDLCAGDRIGPENVEASLDRRFHGQALRDLLPERLLWQIREYGLTLTLTDPRPHDVDPRFAESTRRYSKDVVLDPETGEISGWTAGIPFPDVSGDDPQAALKIIWNVARGSFTVGPKMRFSATPPFSPSALTSATSATNRSRRPRGVGACRRWTT